MRAGEGERAVGPGSADDLELLLEQLEARAERRELEAVGLVLAFVPAGAEAEVDTAARDVVDGCDDLREHRRMAERRRRDEHAEAQPGRDRGEAGERRPGLERAALLVPIDREVVIRAEERAHAVLLAGPRQRDPLGPGHVLLPLDHQLQSHRASLEPLQGEVERRCGARDDAVGGERRQAVGLEVAHQEAHREVCGDAPSRATPTSAGPRTPLPLEPSRSGSLSSAAAPMIGVASRKAKRAASSLESPTSRPPGHRRARAREAGDERDRLRRADAERAAPATRGGRCARRPRLVRLAAGALRRSRSAP